MSAQMKFEEYWAAVAKLRALPDMAIQQLPGSLSKETKKSLIKLEPEETMELLCEAINQINHGSVESVDCLLRKRL